VPDRKRHFSKKNQIKIKKYFLKKFSEPEKSLISQLTSQYSELFLQITNSRRSFPVDNLAGAI
jgi:peptidyl-tRNA hydrolase